MALLAWRLRHDGFSASCGINDEPYGIHVDLAKRECLKRVANIPVDYMSPEDIAKTYAARWEVELIFKELKSYYRIDQLPSASQPIVESLIYTGILTLVISRALLHELRQLKSLSAKESPKRRWAVVFHSVAQKILMLLNHKGRCEKMWSMLLDYIIHELIDPNISRALKLNFECLK